MDVILKELSTGKKVGFIPFSGKLEAKALQLVKSIDGAAGQIGYINECVKLSITEIDGQSVNYETLSDLDDHFSYSEIFQLRAIWNDINMPKAVSPLE